jgi:hypothetical protein
VVMAVTVGLVVVAAMVDMGWWHRVNEAHITSTLGACCVSLMHLGARDCGGDVAWCALRQRQWRGGGQGCRVRSCMSRCHATGAVVGRADKMTDQCALKAQNEHPKGSFRVSCARMAVRGWKGGQVAMLKLINQ